MNTTTNRAVFVAGPSRETYRSIPPIHHERTERAKAAEHKWRNDMLTLRDAVLEDSAALAMM